MRTPQKVGLLLGIIGFFLPLALRFDGLTTAGHIALGILLMAACFWISEPIPIYATSLVVILLGALLLSAQGPLYLGAELPLAEPKRVEPDVWEVPARAVSERGEVFVVKTGGQSSPVRVTVLDRGASTVRVRVPAAGEGKIVADARHPLVGYRPSSYTEYFHTLANPIIILFLGGILLADAAVKYNLDKNLTRIVLRPFGSRPAYIVLGLLMVTGIISAFMSNTATTAMMMTVVLPIIAQLEADDPLRRGVVLAIPFGANIGGIATPVGTPPNAVALAALAKAGIPVPFGTWVLLAAPAAILTTLVAWLVLIWLFPPRRAAFALRIESTFDRSGKAMVLYVVGALTVLLWVTEALHGLSSSLVAFFAMVALIVSGVVDQSDIQKVPWDVLWLVSGGIALDIAMKTTGLGAWLVSRMPWERFGAFGIVVMFGLIAFAMAQMLSHTISATLIIPLAVNLGASGAATQGFNLGVTCVFVGLAVSFGMTLPISTPPNAIATSTGMVQTRDMAKAGALIGVAGILVTLLLAQSTWRFLLR